MIFLEITGAVLIVLALILFSPITVSLRLNEKFSAAIYFCKIRVFRINPDKPKKRKKENTGENKKKPASKAKKTKEPLFTYLKRKYGFEGAVRLLLSFAKQCLTHIKKLLRHIKIKRITVDLSVAGNDAADTAIKFGRISAAFYPVLSFLDSFKNIRFKKINLKSDFSGQKSEFKFSADITLRIFFFLAAAIKIYFLFMKFFSKEQNDEREQH